MSNPNYYEAWLSEKDNFYNALFPTNDLAIFGTEAVGGLSGGNTTWLASYNITSSGPVLQPHWGSLPRLSMLLNSPTRALIWVWFLLTIGLVLLSVPLVLPVA